MNENRSNEIRARLARGGWVTDRPDQIDPAARRELGTTGFFVSVVTDKMGREVIGGPNVKSGVLLANAVAPGVLKLLSESGLGYVAEVRADSLGETPPRRWPEVSLFAVAHGESADNAVAFAAVFLAASARLVGRWLTPSRYDKLRSTRGLCLNVRGVDLVVISHPGDEQSPWVLSWALGATVPVAGAFVDQAVPLDGLLAVLAGASELPRAAYDVWDRAGRRTGHWAQAHLGTVDAFVGVTEAQHRFAPDGTFVTPR